MSIKYKFLYIFTSSTVIPLLLAGTLVFYTTQSVIKEGEFENMDRLHKERIITLETYIRQLTYAIESTSLYPPIQGLIRTESTQIDPVDQSTREQWMRRLQSIFSSLILTNPNIAQVRYLNEHGIEIMHVRLKEGRIDIVTEQKLDDEHEKRYFQEASGLTKDEFFVSPVDLERQHGDIQIPYTPIIRFIKPIYSSIDNSKKGMVIFNVLAQDLFDATFHDSSSTVLFDQDGEFLYHFSEKEKEFGALLNTGHNVFNEQPGLREKLHTMDFEWHDSKDKKEFCLWRKIYYNPFNKDHYWVMMDSIKKDVLFAPIRAIRKASWMIGLLICVGAIFISLVVSRAMVRPLTELNTIAQKIASGDLSIKMDPKLKAAHDEIGELAESFDEMTTQLVYSNIELEHKVADRTWDLEVQEAKMRSIIDAAPDAIIVVDVRKNIVSVNRATESMFGYSADDLAGKSIHILISESHIHEYDRAMDRHLQTGQGGVIGMTHEVQARRKDGAEFFVELSMAEFSVDHERYFTGLVHDITERKEAERERQEKKSYLEKMNRELDSFVYTVSHDLRAPLRGMSSYAGFLKEDYYDVLDDKGKEYISHICKGADLMDRLIEDLLTLSRMSRLHNPFENVNTKDLIDSVIERIEFDIKEHQVKLMIQEDMPTVYCDRIKLAEVFLNLITNAIKFSSKNNPEHPRITMGYQAKNEHWEFFVKDNGIGIDPQFHDQIFGIFQRLHTQNEYEGTGAGLSIVKRVIDDHGGIVWVESALGEGACFRFTIPKKLEEEKTKEHSDHTERTV